tara:strand:- start:1351 stop:1473 length:123 start_codon:yes stop_codon:yes gene_type:complete
MTEQDYKKIAIMDQLMYKLSSSNLSPLEIREKLMIIENEL